MIRPAEVSDIPGLLEMGRKFAEKAKLTDHVGYDPHSMVQTFEWLIEGGHPFFVSDRGTIAGVSTRHPFNHDHIHVQELFWWSEGRDGLKLLKALEDWCDIHAHSLQMITLEAVEPERTGKLYERLGFRPLEHSYIKVF